MLKRKYFIFIVTLLLSPNSKSEENQHYSCQFNNSVFVDGSGVYKGPMWKSKGFSIKDNWVLLDNGKLKLKLTTNIEEFSILRGGDFKEGYQFSLENEKFIYTLLMVSISRSWTITGNCKKD